MVTLLPCEKTKKQAYLAFSWRNDSETIASAYIPYPKVWGAFWTEYTESYFSLPLFPPLFIVKEGSPVGFIRFDAVSVPDFPEKTIIEVMINIAPSHRHQGIATKALSVLKKEMKDKGVFALLADIRKTNKNSIRLFEKTGFDFFKERREYISQTKENCCIVCYLCPL